MNTSECLIPANADIAGIGIRLSVYIQAAISIICISLITILQWDDHRAHEVAIGKIAKHGKAMGQLLFLTGAALITSAAVQDSWLNNITGCTLRTLVVLAGKPKNEDDKNNDYWERLGGFSKSIREPLTEALNKRLATTWNPKMDYWNTCLFLSWSIHWFMGFFLHSIAMSALGIAFWSNPSSFSSRSIKSGCIPRTYYWVFGHIDSQNKYLRIVSLCAYSVISVPILNTFVHTFYICFTGYITSMIYRQEKKFLAIFLSVTALAIPSTFLIWSTEEVVSVNRPRVEHGVEQEWSFGQVFALLTSLLGSGELFTAVWETWEAWIHYVRRVSKGLDAPPLGPL